MDSYRDKNADAKELYYVECEGSNLHELTAVPGVDPTKLYSIDVMEMFETFGIEACRNSILREFREVFEDHVDFHPWSVILDQLTHLGIPTSIYRSGFASTNMSSAFSKITFEVAVQKLIQASSMNEVDNLTGVSGRVALGMPIRGGTGLHKLLYDESAFGIKTSQVDELLDQLLA